MIPRRFLRAAVGSFVFATVIGRGASTDAARLDRDPSAVSPNGKWRIETYAMSGTDRSNIELWATASGTETPTPTKTCEVMFPGKIRDVAVTDESIVIAIGESESPRQVILAITDDTIGDRFLLRQARTFTRTIHAPPWKPLPLGVLLHRWQHVCVFRLGDTEQSRTDETWIAADPRDGRLIEVRRPQDGLTVPSRVGRIVSVLPLDFEGSFLVQWTRFPGTESDYGTRVVGFIYGIVEIGKGVVWQLDSEDALRGVDEDVAYRMRNEGTIQLDGPSGFTIDERGAGRRWAYTISRGGSGLRVVDKP